MGKWSKDLVIFDIPDYEVQAHFHENTLGGNIYDYSRNKLGNTNPGSLFDLIMAAKAGGRKITIIDKINGQKIEL
jgi:hypothetical protein